MTTAASATASATFDVADFIDRQPVGSFQVRVLLLCAAVLFIDGFDTQAIGYVAPAVAQDWTLPRAALGPVFSAGLFGLMLGALIFGPVADRLGRKKIMVFSVLAFGACTFATAFAQEVQRQTANAQALKTAATAGNFSIHPDAAQAMIKGFQDAQDIWLKNQYNVYRLTSTYKLGSTPGAKVISQWNQQIGQQLATAYAALNDILQTQIDAYTQAMKNYQENEANVSNSLRKSGES